MKNKLIINLLDQEKIQKILANYISDDTPPFTVKKVWASILLFDKHCDQTSSFSYKELTHYIRNLYLTNKFGKNWVYLKRRNNSDLYFRIYVINKFLGMPFPKITWE